MSIRIKPNPTAEEIKKALEELQKSKTSPVEKNLKRHFGNLKRGIDGMEYQNTVRNEWD